MREVVLDTETTGLDPMDGHRIIEIGCLELLNHIPTGRTFHVYLNPERDISDGAYEVHGISSAELAGKPLFRDIADDFAAFLDDAALVIHNAAFDLGFINAELQRLDRTPINEERAVDTLMIARRKYPGGQNSLDGLCRRFGIDNSMRDKHGALLDAELLAEVYLELIGGRQPGLGLTKAEAAALEGGLAAPRAPRRARPVPLPERITPEEKRAHAKFVATLGSDSLWQA